MVELRKRKAHQQPSQPPPAKKSNPVKKVVEKVKAVVTSTEDGGKSSPSAGGPPSVGSVVTLDGFGGEVETNDGQKTTLKKLVDESSGGVVLFTYPKASTPGCTNQACMFRDDYTPLTATGFAIYGLSRDSSKANTTFKTKNSLPYTLLCDPSASLIGAIGMKKNATSTTRGVFVVDKSGKVLAAEAGGPGATVGVVKKLVAGQDGAATASNATKDGAAPATTAESAAVLAAAPDSKADVEAGSDKAKADVAADVADTAAKLDSTPQPVIPTAS